MYIHVYISRLNTLELLGPVVKIYITNNGGDSYFRYFSQPNTQDHAASSKPPLCIFSNIQFSSGKSKVAIQSSVHSFSTVNIYFFFAKELVHYEKTDITDSPDVEHLAVAAIRMSSSSVYSPHAVSLSQSSAPH